VSPVPLLILSDAPTAGTGLGRITRDLAFRVSQYMPDEYRVATLGYGGSLTRSLPFVQYGMEMENWVVYNLPEIWKDFAGDEQGIVMTIWDASRLLWFSRPENCASPNLRRWMTDAPFQRWGYFPMDATGPHDRLTSVLKHTIEGYDRVIAYSSWAESILRKTLTRTPITDKLTFLPHGLNTSIFYERPRTEARRGFGERIGAKDRSGTFLSIPDDVLLVGIVATNQVRKDWGLGITVVAEMARTRKVMLWAHTDELERHWSLPALINDFGIMPETIVTTIPLTDEQMACCYSACDVTLGIGSGEGFGFPLAESLACGTPVVHGNYGGGEFVPRDMVVEPLSYRLEGPYNCIRPVFTPQLWAQKALAASRKRTPFPVQLDWNNLWPRWEQWLRDGLQ